MEGTPMTRGERSLASKRSTVVLSVEHEAIIAYGVADDLAEAGFAVAGPYRSSTEALSFLERETPDLAIIEYKLKDQVASDLAQALKDRGVPFVVFSTWRREEGIPPVFEGALWIEKPATPNTIIDALERLRAAQFVNAP
jgi:DNA-binding response OmpR family regulator